MANDVQHQQPPAGSSAERPHGVSIIIPCHNCGETLAETIVSILANQPKTVPFEIIMVNDAPGDAGTAEACEKALQACIDANVTASLHNHDKNQGVSTARNTALAAAKYRYTFPIDADDMLPAGSRFIDKAVQILDNDPDTVLVYPGLRFIGRHRHRPIVPFYDEKEVLVRNTIPCCNVYRTSEALAIGGYSPTIAIGEDHELALALLAKRYESSPDTKRRVRRLLSETYFYRQHAAGQNVTSTHRPNWNRLDHINQLMQRAGVLFDHHYKTRSPEAIQRQFLLGPSAPWTIARLLQSTVTRERPLSQLLNAGRRPKAQTPPQP